MSSIKLPFLFTAALLWIVVAAPIGAWDNTTNLAVSLQASGSGLSATALNAQTGAEPVAGAIGRQAAEQLKRRNEILEAKAELQDAANSRLENYLGAFGILITIVALAFGLSTKQAAVAAARRGIEEEATEVKRLLATARGLLEEIEQHAAVAEAIKNKLTAGPPQAIEDATDKSEAIREGDHTREASPTGDGLNEARVAAPGSSNETGAAKHNTLEQYAGEADALSAKGDWTALLELSREMRRHYKKSQEIAWSQSYEAFALSKLGQSEQAIKVYQKAIDRLAGTTNSFGMLMAARAMFNMAIVYSAIGNIEKEIEIYDQLIKKFENVDSVDLKNEVAKSYINKAVELGRAGKADEAIALTKRVIERYSAFDDPRLKKQVEMAKRYIARR